jgi:hypothetical protein
MKTKIFLIMIIMSFAVGCEDCDSFPDKFNVTGLNSGNNRIYHFDSNGTMIALLNTSLPIAYDSFSLGIYSLYKEYYSQSYVLKDYLSVKRAYACSPKILSSDENIQSIYIKSDSKWNNNYLSGDTLNNIIELIGYRIDALIIPRFPIDFNYFISLHPTAKLDYDLRFKSPPINESTHTFTIYYKQTNGEEYIIESNPVTIKP